MVTSETALCCCPAHVTYFHLLWYSTSCILLDRRIIEKETCIHVQQALRGSI